MVKMQFLSRMEDDEVEQDLKTRANGRRDGDKTAISAFHGFPRYLIRSDALRASRIVLINGTFSKLRSR